MEGKATANANLRIVELITANTKLIINAISEIIFVQRFAANFPAFQWKHWCKILAGSEYLKQIYLLKPSVENRTAHSFLNSTIPAACKSPIRKNRPKATNLLYLHEIGSILLKVILRRHLCGLSSANYHCTWVNFCISLLQTTFLGAFCLFVRKFPKIVLFSGIRTPCHVLVLQT